LNSDEWQRTDAALGNSGTCNDEFKTCCAAEHLEDTGHANIAFHQTIMRFGGS
jgi:hypothetical protein